MTKNNLEPAGFIQKVNDMTRSWPGAADSLIDHCWFTQRNRVIDCKNLVAAAADHNHVELTWRVCRTDNFIHNFWMRNRKHLDIIKYKQDIEEIDWREMYNEVNIDIANKMFEDKVIEVLDRHAPRIKILLQGKKKPWVSTETKRKMKDRDILLRNFRQSGDRTQWGLYKTKRNDCIKQLKLDKKKYYSDIYLRCNTDRDVSNMYRTMRSQLGIRSKDSPKMFWVEGQKICKTRDMAEAQQSFFADKDRKLWAYLPASNFNPLKY